jgi:hypothetical protein
LQQLFDVRFGGDLQPQHGVDSHRQHCSCGLVPADQLVAGVIGCRPGVVGCRPGVVGKRSRFGHLGE